METAIVSQSDLPPNNRLDAHFVILWTKLRPLVEELGKLPHTEIMRLIQLLPPNDATLPIVLPGYFEAGNRGSVRDAAQRQRIYEGLDDKPFEATVQCAAATKQFVAKEMTDAIALQEQAQAKLKTISSVLKFFTERNMPLALAAARENEPPKEPANDRTESASA